ncbi:fructosamine kinase family protein [Thalassospira sp. TSL5-1]|uniref:fructosamine kinase family protein n=1 Tax=Thalassospira sp. TSL5-1 TaxID=1544451 RepID=UPI0009FA28B4|nr:fructosamine kinase family protein [Thalassospira sp. TSL5-1]
MDQKRIADTIGCTVRHMRVMTQSDMTCVMWAELEDTDGGEPTAMVPRQVVVKHTADNTALIEGRMLQKLGALSPIRYPGVLYGDDHLLVMDYIDADGQAGPSGAQDLAQQLAAQHDITQPDFGLEFDTLIGGLYQPNPPCANWLEFFRDQRLLFMAQCASDSGKLPARLYHRIEKLCTRLDEFIAPDVKPSLLHGDLWGGNILYHQGKLAGLIDPALYFGDAEIELAFGTLFGDLNNDFFDTYRQYRPLERDFFTTRRDLYNLYPLLVHVRLFGGSYVNAVDHNLAQLGF